MKKRLNNLNELDDFSGVAEKINTCVQIFNKKATKCLRKKSIHIKMIQVVFLGKYFVIKI